MPLTPDNLTVDEAALWDAFPVGAPVDLRGQTMPAADPGGGRTIRAEVIAALLRGARPAAGGYSAGLHLIGARIIGALDLSSSEITVPWSLQDCQLDSAPDLTGATVRAVRMVGCELPGFNGRLLRVEGDVDLRRAVVRGVLSLIRASITGELRLTGAKLINPGGWALFAGGLVVQSALFGSVTAGRGPAAAPLSVEGGLRLAGARLLGGVFLDGVQVRNPGGVAIHADNVSVFGRMYCGRGFHAEGRIRLPHCRIEGELSFAGGTLTDPEVALVLNNAVVEDLNLRTAEAITGLVDLRHAKCGILRDSVETWPDQLTVDGLAYDAIDAGRHGLDVTNRLAWLRRDPDGFRPQPYERLAALYRGLGGDAEARRVLLDKQRRHRRELRLPGRLLGRLLDSTVGYGYRPWRAAFWLVALLGLGTVAFSIWPPVPDGAARRFDAAVYTLDLLLPISAFGLRDAFAPVGNTRLLAYGLTAAGWLLATALVAGVSRALRRD